MEPPPKRLRILHSVDVDETSPEYINAKQKQQQKFKSRLESIFAKYGNMNESMSDEIDMRTNTIVVDRGHLRRLVRQINRKETVLLDTLGLAAAGEPDVEVARDQVEEESEDELAPTQPLSSGSGRRKEEPRQEGSAGRQNEHSPSSNSRQPESAVNTGTQQVPNTPNPAANLLQYVQFPQTPAGQQAQTSFYATLAQTINQAVQQAVAPLFSTLLPNTPNAQLPIANSFTLPTTPVVNSDKVAPATDPKWFFPPLPADKLKIQVAQSSPIPSTKANDAFQTLGVNGLEDQASGGVAKPNDEFSDSTFSVTAVLQSEQTRRTSPRVEIRRKPVRRGLKYPFTEEDDIYMSKCRMLENKTWQQIKDSRDKWGSWPLATLQQRWSQRLKGKDLHLKNVPSTQVVRGSSQVAEGEDADLPSHHLPTPSSLRHEHSSELVENATPKPHDKIRSSSSRFDKDMLSLSSTDLEEEKPPTMIEEQDSFLSDTNEDILPSVEQDWVDEDILPQGLPENSPMDGITSVVDQKTVTEARTEIVLLSSPSKRKREVITTVHQAMLDSNAEGNADHVISSSSPAVDSLLACNIREAAFRNATYLQRQQDSTRSAHNKPRPRSSSLDLVGDDDDDELQASATPPYIKRKFSTPPPTSFLFSTPAARSDVLSSGVKSASTLNRKAFRKQVQQSWAKRATPAPKAAYKRRSLQTVPRKRAWSADSEDELGM
ncbi:hypothetical protein CC86DRAFT_366746 [Ophiobolus disseminans]|uniref:Myb-like domain-containing protein n=1 Tax=Ophiobolus disseminans TaxID=1469910 RepID=A0A6A7AFL4_9PLEO|nr:hypothetical protein CC86DRAFT_366746 [Ophiobolus disseminans]